MDELNALPDANKVSELVYSEALVAISPLVVYQNHIVESQSLRVHIQKPH
jgi:hypothetical protein